MKKQASKKSKKSTKPSKVPEIRSITIEDARGFSLALFHTTVGPIVGRLDDGRDAGPTRIRLWAPAVVQMSLVPVAEQMQQRITFQPLALVETYIDLSSIAPFGSSPVPDALISAYEDYFDRFAVGEYALRTVARIEQAAPHQASMTPMAPEGDGPLSDPLGAAVERLIITGPDGWSIGEFIDWMTRQVVDVPEDVDVSEDPRRLVVKRTLYGLYYDASADKIAASGDLDPADVTDMMARIIKKFPRLLDYKDAVLAKSNVPGPAPIENGVS